MRNLNIEEIMLICGGMKIDGMRESTNVIDQRGTDNGTYIDANGTCWAPGTNSSTMFPNGGGSNNTSNNPILGN